MNSSGRAGLGQPGGVYCQTVREDSCSTWLSSAKSRIRDDSSDDGELFIKQILAE